MQPKTMYGAPRNSGLACSATTDSLLNSLCSSRYGCHSGGARAGVLQPGAALVDPAAQQRRERERDHDLEQLRGDGGPGDLVHR
jgi:hypothetical protein